MEIERAAYFLEAFGGREIEVRDLATRSVTLFPRRALVVRELRGGLRGFYVFIACIALGVMAIAAASTKSW